MGARPSPADQTARPDQTGPASMSRVLLDVAKALLNLSQSRTGELSCRGSAV